MKKKISCSKEKARELASKFGVSQKTVEEFSYQNKNLGKVLQRNDDPQEPVFEPVAAKDAEVGGIAVDTRSPKFSNSGCGEKSAGALL